MASCPPTLSSESAFVSVPRPKGGAKRSRQRLRRHFPRSAACLPNLNGSGL